MAIIVWWLFVRDVQACGEEVSSPSHLEHFQTIQSNRTRRVLITNNRVQPRVGMEVLRVLGAGI